MADERPVLWQVPTYCPTCGAKVDQAEAMVAERPACTYCGDPLPVTPQPARLLPAWIGDSFRQHRLAIVASAGLALLALLVATFAVTRSNRPAEATVDPSEAPRQDLDHFHIAFGVFVCDHFLPDPEDRAVDRTGIHTRSDGLIHVHPFVPEVSGPNATLAVFGDAVGMTFEDHAVRLPSGGRYHDGELCFDQPGRWVARQWNVDTPAIAPVDITEDLGRIRLDGDRRALTLAFVPEGTDVPKPPSIAALDHLTDVDPARTTSTRRAAPATPPLGTTPTPSSVPVQLDTTPTCSTAGLPAPPKQDGLPSAAQETRRRLAEALTRCDYNALLDLRVPDSDAWWDDAGLPEAQRGDRNTWLASRYQAATEVAALRTAELEGKPALAPIADALTHSYYCKTERPTDAWAVGDPAVCFWLSGTNSTGAPGALTTLTISSHGSWAGTSTWGPTETPSIFVEGGPGPEMPGPLVLRNGWVGPPPTRMAPWPNDWPRLAADK